MSLLDKLNKRAEQLKAISISDTEDETINKLTDKKDIKKRIKTITRQIQQLKTGDNIIRNQRVMQSLHYYKINYEKTLDENKQIQWFNCYLRDNKDILHTYNMLVNKGDMLEINAYSKAEQYYERAWIEIEQLYAADELTINELMDREINRSAAMKVYGTGLAACNMPRFKLSSSQHNKYSMQKATPTIEIKLHYLRKELKKLKEI